MVFHLNLPLTCLKLVLTPQPSAFRRSSQLETTNVMIMSQGRNTSVTQLLSIRCFQRKRKGRSQFVMGHLPNNVDALADGQQQQADP
jgi:hypothetical protein